MADPLRTGIIGTGGWGTHIATQFHENPDTTVVAITDISDANRLEAGETLEVGPDHQYENYESMLADERLDAVQISSPHALHHDHILAALEADLHVFCEKPLTIGVGQAAELVRESDASDRVVMVGYQRHVHPAYAEIRGAIERGDLEPKLVTAELTQGWIEKVDGTWRVDPALSGGGQLYDSGSHLLDAIVWMVDQEPSHVTAEMEFDDDAERIDVQAALTVRFEGGAIANVTVSGDSPDVTERIAVRGDEGRHVISGEGWDHRELTTTDADGTERDSIAADLSSYDKVDAFVQAVRTGEEPPATARNAFYATALTEAAYEAARTGERVDVETTL